MTTTVDFERIAERAATMSIADLHYAILDCVRTAEAMDSLDRTDNGNRAGRYRDEAAVYRAEMGKR